MLNGHGDDIYNYRDKIVSNFSSNICNSQDLQGLQEYLCSRIVQIHSYPEPDAHSLALLLAKKHSMDAGNICVTNGATEAIYLLAQAFAGSETAIIVPTFSEYEDACKIHNHTVSFYQHLEEVKFPTSVVWICNPNNPNGYVYDIDYLEKIVTLHKDTLFIFDQSYGYFTNKPVWDIKKAADHKNVILLHSMTKEFAIPGLRLGYFTAHKDILHRIERYRMPWSVNTLAIEAGKFLLKGTNHIFDIKSYLDETKNLQQALKQIERLSVFPTDTHFFLCKLNDGKASELKVWLIDNYGILIRDAANFRGLDEYYFRIATQSASENELLVKAIKEWI